MDSALWWLPPVAWGRRLFPSRRLFVVASRRGQGRRSQRFRACRCACVRRSPAGSTSYAAATPCIPLPSASAGTGKPWPRAMASRRPIPSRSVKLSNLVGGHRRNRPSRKTRRSSLRPWRPSLPRFHPQLVRRYLPSPHRLRPRPRPHPAAARLPSSRGLRWGVGMARERYSDRPFCLKRKFE